jgi:TonB family protein
MVLRHGISASTYAAELLEIARSFGRNTCPSVAIPMATSAGCSDLEDRLRNVLNPRRRQTAMGFFRFSAALSCLSLLTMATSAFTLSAQPFTNQQRTSTMTIATLRNTVFSGLLASAGLSAATIGGAILDPSGAPVVGATASIYSPDNAVKKEVTTTGGGKFAFESLPAGSYILRIEKAGLPTLFREYKVVDNSALDHGLTMGDNAPPAETPAPGQIRVAAHLQEEKLIRKVTPVYPVSAKKAHIQGIVQLEMVLSKEGVPQDIRVISSPSDDLTQSALEAVSQWRYETTLLNGNPVSVITDVNVHYTLLE